MLLLEARVTSGAGYAAHLFLSSIKREEQPKYLALHNEIFEGVDNASFSRGPDIASCFEKNRYEIMFVATKEGIVGICEYEYEGSDAIIDTIGILPAFRGRGLARDLLKNVFYILASQGIGTVRLVTASTNKPGLGLYRSFGFRIERTLSRWYECLEC
jgi:ribosomal protein S18 acetylase RimI-like enzyme